MRRLNARMTIDVCRGRLVRGMAIWLTVIAGSTLSLAGQAPSGSPLAGILAAGGAYVAEYQKQIAAIGCEEKLHESAGFAALSGGGPREPTLRSDVVWIDGESAGWIGLRDVFEVDGASSRPRDDRLAKVLMLGAPGALDNARRMVQEGSRYHIGNVNRSINTPMHALSFLRLDNQARSAFSFDGMKTVDRIKVGLVVFRERSMPRVLRTAGDAAAEGKLWIEPDSGRVVRSELVLKADGVTATIAVRYASEPKLGLWLPVRLDEEYATVTTFAPSTSSGRPPVNGQADYRDCRKLDVDVSRIIG